MRCHFEEKIPDGFSPVNFPDGIFPDGFCRRNIPDGFFADGILQMDFADGFFWELFLLHFSTTVTL
jgi:hypothetical protein